MVASAALPRISVRVRVCEHIHTFDRFKKDVNCLEEARERNEGYTYIYRRIAPWKRSVSFDTLRSAIRNSHYRNECTLWESVLRRTRQRVKTEGSVGMGSKEVEKRLEYRRVFWCVIVGCWMEVYIYIYIFFEILSDIVRLILFKYLLVRDNYCQGELQREKLFFSDFWITILNYWMIICLDCAGIRLRKIGCGEKEILDVWSGRRLKWNSFYANTFLLNHDFFI